MARISRLLLISLLMTVITACGGGGDDSGGGGGGGGNATPPPSGLSYPSPQSFTVGTAATAISPTVSGTVSSYAVSPALPEGLSLNASTGQISGTPTIVAAANSYAVTASNSGGSTTFSLSISVLPAAPASLSYPGTGPFPVGVAITPLSPTVTGTVTGYSVSPTLPAGLAINATTGVISGTPTGSSAATSYLITAQGPGGSTTFSVSLSVQSPPPSGLFYANPQTFVVHTPITPIGPGIAGSVVGYSVSPSLPEGLSLNPNTGVISGTPTALTSRGNYIISATNSGGQTFFALSIAVVIPPPSGLFYTHPYSIIQGQAITPWSPQVFGVVSQYTAMPALPAGLTLNPTTGVISGTPTEPALPMYYQVSAANSSGISLYSMLITVLDAPPSNLSYPSPQTFTAETAISPLDPTVTGVVSYYDVEPLLPDGLDLDPSTGRISGTPTTAVAQTNYVVTASNSTGQTSFILPITVRIAAPRQLSYQTPQTFNVGTAIAAMSPSVTGVVASYAVQPALPAGLSLNPTTGRISGIPTAASTATSYQITASNSTGSTSFNLSIAVTLLPPSGLSYPTPRVFALNVPITALSPMVAGVVDTYSVSPALPAGLSLDGTTGVLSGTPSVLTVAANYTVMATNGAGSTTFDVSIAVENVGITPTQISRIAAVGTPVVVALKLQGQSLAGTLYATASDAGAVFSSSVGVATVANGYALSLTISTTKPAGHYTGTVSINLCSDPACNVAQNPGSISVPFDVQILSDSSAWPGNNLGTLVPWPNVPDWNMFQGNAAHTGYVPVSVDPNRFSTRWRGPSLNNTAGYYGPALTLTTNAGRLFIAYGTSLYALKEHDASQLWTQSFASLTYPSVNPPAVGNGMVFIAVGQQGSTSLRAYDEVDGSAKFTSAMNSQWENYLAPTIGPNGVYTNAGTYGGLYGFNFSGQQMFFASLDMQSMWTPAVDDSHVYSYTGRLTVVDPQTGAVQANINDPSFTNYVYRINGSAVLGAPGSVFAAPHENAYLNGGGIGNKLTRFDAIAQNFLWQVAGVYPRTPAYDSGVVYIGNNNPLRLEARSESNGDLLWSWTPPLPADSSFNSEVLLTDSTIFVATDKVTYGIDRSTHQVVFSYPLSGRLALSRSGVLYIQGVGPIVAINVK